MSTTEITVAYGDGIGPEIMEATLGILKEAGAKIDIDVIEIGEKIYNKGVPSGIEDSAWDSIKRTKCFLKAPITTPQGGGFKSLNVTIRKSMGMFANVRPCVAYHPFVATTQPNMDMVIVRENEEDLYAGIEYRQTDNVVQALKIISSTGSERIIRYAFEYARTMGRKKVSCISKDNIMKMADGLFHKIFDRVATEYPEIESNHWIVDIGAAKIAANPEIFDVVVTENLYGDIISDIAAEVSGSVGLGGSSNIGEKGAMFEAIHGSAPDISGKGIANPSGLLHGAILMLQHIGQAKVAQVIHNAWLRTIEDGIHTGDIVSKEYTTEKVNTAGFAHAIKDRLGLMPEKLPPATYANSGENREISIPKVSLPPREEKKLVGVDVFLNWRGSDRPEDLAKILNGLIIDNMALEMISTKGLKVWPDGIDNRILSDHWCCRFIVNDSASLCHNCIIGLLQQLKANNLDFIKIENLYNFAGQRAYTVAQGQ